MYAVQREGLVQVTPRPEGEAGFPNLAQSNADTVRRLMLAHARVREASALLVIESERARRILQSVNPDDLPVLCRAACLDIDLARAYMSVSILHNIRCAK